MMTNHGVCQDITGGGGWSPVLLLLQSSERAGHAISMTSEEDKYMCGRAAGYLGLCVCVCVWWGGFRCWKPRHQFSTYPEENA